MREKAFSGSCIRIGRAEYWINWIISMTVLFILFAIFAVVDLSNSQIFDSKRYQVFTTPYAKFGGMASGIAFLTGMLYFRIVNFNLQLKRIYDTRWENLVPYLIKTKIIFAIAATILSIIAIMIKGHDLYDIPVFLLFWHIIYSPQYLFGMFLCLWRTDGFA